MSLSLLEKREKTDFFEKELLNRFPFKTLVVIRANMPGGKKGSIESNWIVYRIFLECKKKMAPLKIFHSYTDEEGLIFFLIVDAPPLEVKALSIKIEDDEALGRLADIDVLTAKKLFSRNDFPHENKRRKCFLCEKDAVICARSRAHSQKEIMNFILKKVHEDWSYDGDIFELLGNLTESSLLAELCRPLGFGCVTANSQGSHKDMDFLLMLKCIPLIGSAIKNLSGKDCESFEALREYGKKQEKKLFDLTGGVNTYKGALFLLLILNACTFRIIKEKKAFTDLSKEIADFSLPLKKDFELKACSPSSLQAFNNLGSGGVRGLALSGFAEHFQNWLPLYKKTFSEGGDFVKIIVKMIETTCDTTIIKRKGEKALLEVQKKAHSLLCIEEGPAQERAIKEFSEWCEKNNISTGGTADKIIILYNLKLIREIFKDLISKTVKMPEISPLVKELTGIITESDLESISYMNRKILP
ncbi:MULTISPECIES: citrate lyase holo-[acyl-carrier protein] synthase [Treponema]|uniref:CitXG protein, putative n=1 Tax=Treponema denticola (strain ATCC 35405 / DSM 14222 / CIP 103919 / JCM 8153 / KCTC 15104) TaxID=243275 RepID=Q73MI5_TREDE|nr:MULTISPECIES: citrate lyase holo-[acyl-carrier protein] synthase [Treponema]AAS12040.1 citXG protein, putative [Treponema denticola ATCC 35405]EMB36959.1 holo-ACP synthase CitX [Treponema denticola ATCC 33521]EMB41568.1 holo-ACP synthase CitX [Treponema denticola ATCC 35404]HCY96291.1 citrate lyase holo-[acyl-carrier protein] synthase [Treponema sp.]